MTRQIDVTLHVCEVAGKLPGWEAAPPSVWHLPGYNILVDTGLEDEHFVAQLLATGTIDTVLITHGHHDHTGNLARLLQSGEIALFGPEQVCQAFPEARRLSADGLPCTVLPAPGHTDDHLTYLFEDGTFFSGDLVLGEGTPWVGPPEGDLPVYLNTLERLKNDTRLKRLCGGHGPIREDANKVIRDTLAHRMMREKMIREVRDSGVSDARDIAQKVYNGIEKMGISGLQFEMAVWTVQGHLQRLESLSLSSKSSLEQGA